MLLSQSSIRLPADAGTQLTVSEAAFIMRADLVGRDEPLGGQPERQLLAAAPAARIAVLVLLGRVEQALGLQAVEDGGVGLADALAGELAEAVGVDAGLVDRRDDRQAVDLRQLVVLGAAARGDVDDAGALFLADVLPGDDRVLDARPGPRAPRTGCGSAGRPARTRSGGRPPRTRPSGSRSCAATGSRRSRPA